MPAHAFSVGRFPRSSGDAAALTVSANLATCSALQARGCPQPIAGHLPDGVQLAAPLGGSASDDHRQPPAVPRMRWKLASRPQRPPINGDLLGGGLAQPRPLAPLQQLDSMHELGPEPPAVCGLGDRQPD
eukprot:11548569-Alexandrium_andersonii.AAC.1